MGDPQAVADCELMVRTLLESPNILSLRTLASMNASRADPLDLRLLLSRCPAAHVDIYAHAVLQCLPPAGEPLPADDIATVATLCGVALRCNLDADAGEPPCASTAELALRLAQLCAGASRATLAVVCRELNPLISADDTSLGAPLAPHLLPELLTAANTAGTKVADYRRLLDARRMFASVDLKRDGPNEALRMRTLKAACEPALLRSAPGQKFVATLLTLPHIRAGIFDALHNSLAFCGKGQARHIGSVFVLALRIKGTQRFRATLINIVEKAVTAGCEPLASNLRAVLGTLHASRTLQGADTLLHRVYNPVIFPNLLVANAYVRRNAVLILCDAYPVHDPAASRATVESTIHIQVDRLAALLEDPVPFVRIAAVQGATSLLARMYAIVPPGKARAMVDVLTNKVAFDRTSAMVRAAVVDGLCQMTGNPDLRPILIAALPRVANLLHDAVDRVRIAVLKLLLQVRKVALLPFVDVVPIEELLFRLEDDSSPAVVALIMQLISKSYFPVKPRKDDTGGEDSVKRRQMHCCHSMLAENMAAARTFYRHLYLYVQPRPLVEFASNAFNEVKGATAAKAKVRPKGKTTKRRRAAADADVADAAKPLPDPAALLEVTADVLQTLAPALAKDANRKLRQHVDKIYVSSKLLPYMTEAQHSLRFRIAAWRVARILCPTAAKTLRTTLRAEVNGFSDVDGLLATEGEAAVQYLGALMQCCVAWDMCAVLADAVEAWRVAVEQGADAKRKRGAKAAANAAVNALIAVGDALTSDDDLGRQFLRLLEKEVDGSDADEDPPSLRVLQAVRCGCQAAVDTAVQRSDTHAARARRKSLVALTAAWRLVNVAYACCAAPAIAGHVEELLTWAAGDAFFEQCELLDVAPLFACVLSHAADTLLVTPPSDSATIALDMFVTRLGVAFAFGDDDDEEQIPACTKTLVAELRRLDLALKDVALCAQQAEPAPDGDERDEADAPTLGRLSQNVEHVCKRLSALIRAEMPSAEKRQQEDPELQEPQVEDENVDR